jgi:Uma2 family endonuclease
MSLEDFEPATTPEGGTYELDRGTIVVSDVPPLSHLRVLMAVRDALILYHIANPQHARHIACRGEAKLVIEPFQSERKPDVMVYCDPPPDGPDVWSVWVPQIVVENVTPESAEQDYDRKPDEYLAFGVQECWIVDSQRRRFTALNRWRGQWQPRELRPGQTYTTWRLPGFRLGITDLFGR